MNSDKNKIKFTLLNFILLKLKKNKIEKKRIGNDSFSVILKNPVKGIEIKAKVASKLFNLLFSNKAIPQIKNQVQ